MKKQLPNYALIMGHMVECFDATIYGFYAVILAPYFFPPNAPQALLSFGAFSAGFLGRPLGALFFGFLGDKFGRKTPLLATMALVGFPTLIIGILPTYHQIGMCAPFILFTCRFAQGFFFGAEYAGVNVYTYETHNNQSTLGFKMATLVAAGSMGAVIATALGAFFTMDSMPKQAWRIPFILGGLAAFFVFFWRRSMDETSMFKETQKNKRLVKFPTAALWKYKREVLVSLFIFSLNTAPLYLVTVFGNHMFREFGYSSSQSMLLNMSVLIFDSIMIVLYGRLSDYVGFEKQIIWGCLWLLIMAIPSFHLVTTYPSLITIYIFMLLISTGNTLVASCTNPYISSLFPVNCRFSALALSFTLGGALISGNTPAVADYLTKVMHTKAAPALWLMFISLLSLLGIFWLRKARLIQKSFYPLDFAGAK